MKLLRRVLLALVIFLVVLVVGVVGVIVADSMFGAQATDYTNVTYPGSDGATLHAYLAAPENDGEGPWPAVIMVHEWWGLNEEIVELADVLAAEGYLVLAPDTYRGPTTSLIPRALFLRLTIPEDRVDADMQAAFVYLAARDDTDEERIAVMGFCYGGGVALRHSVQNPAIAATINLYGDRITDPDDFGALLLPDSGPVLGIFGMEDAQIPVTDVETFRQALETAGIEHIISIYEGVGHAFVQPDVLESPGAPREAWQQILAFLAEHLRQS
jgi:carboxymethylenebutenolidase